MLIQENGRIHLSLIQLCWMLNLDVDPDIDPQDLNGILQEHWLRKQECRHQLECMDTKVTLADVKNILAELGMIHAIYPNLLSYEGAIVHGAMVSRMQLRLEHLQRVIALGVTFKQIFLLTSCRTLYEIEQDTLIQMGAESISFPEDEEEAMRFLFEKTGIGNSIPATLVIAPDTQTLSGKIKAANTNGTLEALRIQSPEAGKYLSISSQPFVPRQTLATDYFLPSCLEVEGIGCVAPTNTTLRVYLDEIARLLYQELKIQTEISNSQPQ